MFNNNQGINFNSNIFNNHNNNNKESIIFKLRLLAGCIGVLCILKLIAGDYKGFNSDLMTCLFIFLTTYCMNGFLSGFLVITLIFSVVITSVFFALQLQNKFFDIPDIISKNTLIFLYFINTLGLLFYSFAIYYCYKFYSESLSSNNSVAYSFLNDNPAPQQRNYGSFDDNERQKSETNFKAFTGSGVRLDS